MDIKNPAYRGLDPESIIHLLQNDLMYAERRIREAPFWGEKKAAEEKAAERELRSEMASCLGRVAAVRAQAEAKVRDLQLRLEKPPLVAHSSALGEQLAQAEPKSVLVTNSHRCGTQPAVRSPAEFGLRESTVRFTRTGGQTTPESGSDGDASSDVAVVRRPWAYSRLTRGHLFRTTTTGNGKHGQWKDRGI